MLADCVVSNLSHAFGRCVACRSRARALRVAGKVDPVFVDDVGDLAAAIVDHARDGDVVISMGAGSIAAVPQRVADMTTGVAQ